MPNLCIIPSRALKDERLTPTAIRVLLAVGHFTSRDGGGVWASNATLAEVAGLHERHLRTALRVLVDCGYVRKIDRPGRTAIMAVVLDDPLEAPCTKSVQGTPHQTRAGGCTDSVRRTTQVTTPLNESSPPARVRDELRHFHHRVAYDALTRNNPAGRAAIDYELLLAAEGGERPGVGLVTAEGWERVGEALHQLVCGGRAFSSRSLGTYLAGLDPLPAVAPAPARPAASLPLPDEDDDPLTKAGL